MHVRYTTHDGARPAIATANCHFWHCLVLQVKSTEAQDKTWCEVSHQEWALAQSRGNSFVIVRVYGAGSANARIAIVQNPYLKWCVSAAVALQGCLGRSL
jgi:hypothetical protein